MAAFYVKSNYTDEELANLNAESTVAYRSLADAQAAAAASTDAEKVIVFEGGTYSEIAKVEGVTYQFDGNIVYTGNAALDLSGSSMIVNVGEGGVDTATAVITAVNNVTVNYGTVTFTGNGETYFAGYVADDDLYVKSGIVYNDSSIAADTEAGATVMVNANGATFAAVYGTTAKNGAYQKPQDGSSVTYYWKNGANVFIGKHAAGQVWDSKNSKWIESNETKLVGPHVVVSGATISGNFHLTGDTVKGDAYRLVADSSWTGALYAAYGANISGSLTVDMVNVSSSVDCQIFRSTVTIANDFILSVSGSTFRNLYGSSGGRTGIGGKVKYVISNSSLTGIVDTAMIQDTLQNTSYINGGVEYIISNSVLGNVTAGLSAKDSYRKTDGAKTKQMRIILDENLDPVFSSAGRILTASDVTLADGESYRYVIYSSYYIGNDVNVSVENSRLTSLYGSSNRTSVSQVSNLVTKTDEETGTTTTSVVSYNDVKKYGALSYIIDGDITISLKGSTVGTVYGNGQADVNGDVKVIFDGSTVTSSLIGSNSATFTEVSFDETDTVNYNKITERAANVTGDVNLTVIGADNYAKSVSGFKTITVTADAVLNAGTVNHTGTITVDANNKTGKFKVIDVTNDSVFGTDISITNAAGNNYVWVIEDKDLYVTALDTAVVYINSDWAGTEDGKMVVANGGKNGLVYGVHAFSSLAEAAEKAPDSEVHFVGGIYDAPLAAEGEQKHIIISYDTTINDWTGIASVTIKNGAVLTTKNWDSSKTALTIDLTGVTTKAANAGASVIYTGDEKNVNWGIVTVTGSDTAGGWLEGNNIFAGTQVLYNDASLYGSGTAEKDVIVLGGATFSRGEGKTFAVTDHKYSSTSILVNGETVSTTNFCSLATKNKYAKVIYLGSKYEPGYIHASTHGNVVFYGATVSGATNYDTVGGSGSNYLHFFSKDSYGPGNGNYTYNDDRTVSIINSYFMGGSPTVFYNATGSGNATLNVIGSTFVTNLGFNRSSATFTGTFTMNVSGSTLGGGMNGSRSGATSIGGYYYTFSDNSKVTGNIKIGGNSSADHKVNGDVSVIVLSGSTVTGAIYGIISDTNYTVNGNIDIEVRDAGAGTVHGAYNVTSGYAGAVGGNVTITLSNATLDNVYTAGNGAVVNGGAYVKLEGNAKIKNSLSASSDTVALGSHLQISGVKNVIEVAGDIALFNTITLADGADLTLTNAGISLTASAQEGVASVITVGKNADLNVAGTVSGAIILKSGAYFKAGALAEGTVITIDETTALTDIIFVDVAAESNYTITSSKSVGKSGNLSYIYDADALYEYYVNAAWASEETGTIITTVDGKLAVVGINAFASIDDTIIKEGNTIYLNGNFDTISAGETANVSFVVNGKVFANSVAADAVTISGNGALIITGDLTDDLTVTLDNINSDSNKAVFGITGSVAEGKTFNVNAPEGFSGYTAGNFYFVTTRQAEDTYVNTAWTNQADVDASEINAVWGVNAFANLTGAIDATRVGKTIHFVGGDSNFGSIYLDGTSLVVGDDAAVYNLIYGGKAANSYGDVEITVNNTPDIKDVNLIRVYGGCNGAANKDGSASASTCWRYGDTVINVNGGCKLNFVVGSGMGAGTYGDIAINLNGTADERITVAELTGGAQENNGFADIYGNISINAKYINIDEINFGNKYGSSYRYDKDGLNVTGDIVVSIDNSYITRVMGVCHDGSYRENNTAKSLNLTMTNTTVSETFYLIGDTKVTGDVVFNATNVTVNTGLSFSNSSKYTVDGNVTLNFTDVTVTGSLNANLAAGNGKILNLAGTNSVDNSVAGFDTINIAAGAKLTARRVAVGNIKVALAADGAEELLIIDTNSGITVTGNISGDNEYDVYVFNGDLWASKKLAAAAVGYEADENGFATINGTQVQVFETLEAAQVALRAGGTIYTKTAIKGVENVENTVVNTNIYAVDGDAANAELTISGSTTGAVLGGGSSSGSKVGTDSAEGFVGGTINLALTNSNVGTVYGGGYSSETGKITLNISGSTCNKMVYGGNVTNTGSLTDDTESTIGDVALTINGGEFKDKVVGGSRVVASGSKEFDVTTNVGNVTLNINGGDFADTIFGAGYVLGNNKNTAQLNVAGVTMTLNDMTITNTNTLHGIYAGGLAARGANISVGTVQTRSAGSAVNITVNSGKYTSIYGGGWAESGATVTVYGVSINVTGGEIANLYGGGNNDQSGARTYVDGDVLITISGGKVDNVCAGAKFVTSKVKGSSTVRINGEAEIGNLCGLSNNNYDGVIDEQILDIDAALKCNSISGFDIIDIAAGKDIDIASAFDLGGVELNIAEQAVGWDVLSATELNGLAEALVTLNGQEATWNGSMFASTSYTLTVTENEGKKSLIFGTITA